MKIAWARENTEDVERRVIVAIIMALHLIVIERA